MQKVRNLWANAKNKAAAKAGYALLLIAPVVMATSCKKEVVCNDYTDPNCENYDPARVRTEQLKADSTALTAKFRQDFIQMNSDVTLSNSFMWRFNNHLQGSTVLKDSVNSTDLAIDEMHTAYGNPISGATTEQNAIVDNTKKTCVDWFAVCEQLGHTR